MFLDQFAQDHDHHDARGKVVENGREEERQESNTPQQCALAFALHHTTYPVKSTILVHDLHDGHGTHEEEQRRGGVTQVLGDGTAGLVDKFLTAESWQITARIDHEQRPADHKHQQGNGCFVDFCRALQGYEQIAHAEHDNNCDS